MMLMRWQLAYPGQALPVIGNVLGADLRPGLMPDGVMTPDFYNSFGAMHGTIMVFLGDCAAGVRRLRQLRRAAADRRAGHDVPAGQHGELRRSSSAA